LVANALKLLFTVNTNKLFEKSNKEGRQMMTPFLSIKKTIYQIISN